MSHMGRPDGQPNAKFSLKQIVPDVEKQLGKSITFLPDCTGPETVNACKDPAPGTVFLLENLRYHVEEEGKGLDATGKKVRFWCPFIIFWVANFVLFIGQSRPCKS